MGIKENLKNIAGWSTNRKIIVFSIDDYGNVRVDSKTAREKMSAAGMKVQSAFDAYDALETRADLEILYDALSSVKDKNGSHAVFTPFALPCNINFEKMAEEGYEQYQYELLPDTYKKLGALQPQAYENTWDLWKTGISNGLMVPQFHGREHLNLKVFEEKLLQRDKALLTALSNRSYTSISPTGYPTISYTAAFDFWDFEEKLLQLDKALLTALSNRSYTSISPTGYPTISYTAAFDFWDFEENDRFESIIQDGLNAFEKVYGYRSTHFNPPGGREHPVIHRFLQKNGIKYSDTPWVKKEHQGRGKYKTVINYTGKRNHLGMIYEVRNVVFEPANERGIDWINFSMQQIETAFRWKRPAIISSHRVNYCGHIDESNRRKGIDGLKKLLQSIVRKWPDAEFMSADKVGALMEKRPK